MGKRLTKAPKLYLRDTGLLHHLLNINTLAELENHPIRGASWETFVLEDVIRRERLRFPHSQCYFWRTQAGAEVDLVLDRGSERFAVEIKTGWGDKGQVVRTLEQAMLDMEAKAAWVIDQADGVDPVRLEIERRGFTESVEWLPG